MTRVTDPDDRALRLELVAAGAKLASSGLIFEGEGNFSARVGERHCLITPAGHDKGRLEPADLLLLRLDGTESSMPASSEARVHLAVYSRRPDAAAIVHAHPPHVQALAALGRAPQCDLLMEAKLLLERVAWVPCLEPGSEALASAVATSLERAHVCVLESHGAVAVGTDVAEAVRRMLLLDRLAAVTSATIGR